MPSVDLLVVVRSDDAARFYKNLSAHDEFRVQLATHRDDALDIIADADQHVDVLVLDNNLDDSIFEFVTEIRARFPRLLIVLVDEEADFGMPGQADDLSTDPFANNDLVERIRRLIADRRMETLRSDSLPAVRSINHMMKQASGATGKQDAAVRAVIDQGYDYAAYYNLEAGEPLALALKAQAGPSAITSIAPKTVAAGDLMAWVVQNSQSRIAGPSDSPNHPLVARGRLGAVACVPVRFEDHSFGVIAAFRDMPGSISQDNVLVLELIGVQLGSALHQDARTPGG